MGACYEFYHFMLGKYKAREYLHLAIWANDYDSSIKNNNFLFLMQLFQVTKSEI
jgi:hypothetical protein